MLSIHAKRMGKYKQEELSSTSIEANENIPPDQVNQGA